MNCLLCKNSATSTLSGPDTRNFYFCKKCFYIFTPDRPTQEEEKQRYLQHNNGIEYPGYVDFLNQAITPALPFIDANMQGLDFGCGPAPTLDKLLKLKKINCDVYDPIFFPELKNKLYDFIFATECFEHFFYPAKEINLITELLQPEGILIIMTELWTTQNEFKTWYYAKDPTHVGFFHHHTLEFIASEYNLELIPTNHKRVNIFKKK